MIRELARLRILVEDRPADAAHVADRRELLAPRLDGAERFSDRFVEAPAAQDLSRRLPQVIEIELVQAHPVVLEPRPPDEFGELRIRPGLGADDAHLRDLLAQ